MLSPLSILMTTTNTSIHKIKKYKYKYRFKETRINTIILGGGSWTWKFWEQEKYVILQHCMISSIFARTCSPTCVIHMLHAVRHSHQTNKTNSGKNSFSLSDLLFIWFFYLLVEEHGYYYPLLKSSHSDYWDVPKIIIGTMRTFGEQLTFVFCRPKAFFNLLGIWTKVDYVRTCAFLSDPGVPGVRSMGPDLCPSHTICRLNWCDSGWWG